jgi:hypothetical protein
MSEDYTQQAWGDRGQGPAHVIVDSAGGGSGGSGTVAVSNFPASQPVTESHLPNLDIALTALRDALRGVNSKTLSDVVTALTTSLTVTGTVTASVSNFPALQPVSVTDPTRTVYTITAALAPAAAEAMVSCTPQRGGTTAAAATSFTVTAGKRFRIQRLAVVVRASTTTAASAQVNLRISATGAVTTASPIVATTGATSGIVANQSAAGCADFADGLELSGTQQFGVSMIGVATGTATITLTGYEI